jgi:vacuolar-type H+-ATPase subunit H
MELISKIKDAEKQADEIINKVKEDSINVAEDFKKSKAQQIGQAEAARRKAIDDAVAAAQVRGEKEVEQLHSQANEQSRQLIQEISPKIPSAVNKVMEYLKG